MFDIRWERIIRKRLAEKGWGVREFAEALSAKNGKEVSQARAGQIITARNPRAKTIRMVARALGLNTEQLFPKAR